MQNHEGSAPDEQADAPELTRLRERLQFYEQFDQLIQSNVSQAGALLREAIDLRESASHDAAQSREDLLKARSADRERYRSLFADLMDEITTLQGQAERLARRLTDAIDQIEAELSAGTPFPSLPSTIPPAFAERGDPAEIDDLTGFDELPMIEAAEQMHAEAEVKAALELGEGDSAPPAERENEPVPATQAAARPAANPTAAGAGTGQVEPSGAKEFVLLIHGVPNTAAALSIKRHLEGLGHVQQVEPREFAAGLLRLQLKVSRPVTAPELEPWSGSSPVMVLHQRPDLLELMLHREN